MQLPIRPVRRPEALRGRRNGRLPDDVLVTVRGLQDGPDVRLVAPAARAWAALCDAALADGHVLKSKGSRSSYRPLADQVAFFKDYYSLHPSGGDTKVWRGRTWFQRPGKPLAALPGTSNHGYGLAVDTGEERDHDVDPDPLDRRTLRWLVAHEERFGFSHEVPSETWHIRYFAGDDIPAAVLDHESRLEAMDVDLSKLPDAKAMFNLTWRGKAPGQERLKLGVATPETPSELLNRAADDARSARDLATANQVAIEQLEAAVGRLAPPQVDLDALAAKIAALLAAPAAPAGPPEPPAPPVVGPPVPAPGPAPVP